MIGALVRVILGFALAALTAGLVFVLFALPPGELISNRSPGVSALIDWSLKAATQAAIFAAPFALIAAAIGEWQSLRGPIFYSIAGLLIAAAGFLAQQSSETAGQLTVVNSYAMGAFFASGLLGGLVYWLIAGRMAGEDEAEPELPRPAAAGGAGGGGKVASVTVVAEPKAAVEPNAADAKSGGAKSGDASKAAVGDAKPAPGGEAAGGAAIAAKAERAVADAKAIAEAVTARIAEGTRPPVSDPEGKI